MLEENNEWPANSKPQLIAELTLEIVSEQKVLLCWQAVELPKRVAVHFFQTEFDELIQVVRVYDVTNILFNGSNAPHYYEMAVPNSQQYWFVKGLPANRYYLTELGVVVAENGFFPLLRSNHILLGSQSEEGQHPETGYNYSSPAWRDHVSTYSYYQESLYEE